LILIHGLGENPHYFDDLAPAFTDRFRVVAYARRGHGQSDAKGPYDTVTLTEDLRGLMDGLGIAKANLAGHSMGGNEITAMAGTHPERVDRIVYLDAAYDWADPTFVAAFKAIPSFYMDPPPSVFKSLDAYRTYQRTLWFLGMSDPSRYEAWLRDSIIVQPDGTVQGRMSDSAGQALVNTLLTEHRDYTKVHSPAFAIYSASFPDTRNEQPAQLAENLAWEQKYIVAFRAASAERVRREVPNIQIANVPGNHMDFVFVSRTQVVAAMRRFLLGSAPQDEAAGGILIMAPGKNNLERKLLPLASVLLHAWSTLRLPEMWRLVPRCPVPRFPKHGLAAQRILPAGSSSDRKSGKSWLLLTHRPGVHPSGYRSGEHAQEETKQSREPGYRV
jgi:pimeloyl-ACP methyl ester carboxylesterase